MDGQRFDDLARSLAAGSASRRSLIKAFAGGVVGGVLALADRDRATTAKGKDRDKDEDCKPADRPQSKCRKDAQCCAGLVCQESECQSGCRIDGTFYAPGAANPSDPCLLCRPTISTVAWSVGEGESCDDGNPCTSNDVCDATGTCAGTLILPSIACPADVTSSTAVGTCGATAAFTVPAGTCADTVSCTHASGSSFDLGATSVTCTATNAAGSTQCSFSVTVEDGQDPSPQCPAPITVAATPGATSAIVSFAATATDNCGGVQIACNPPSGSSFPLGTTPVTCTATDGSGETATCEFTVTVNCTPDCAGKACGASDGCGGACVGTCPDPGPCKVATCNQTSKQCDVTNAPQFTDCSDACTHAAICDGLGNCTGGFTEQCPSQTFDPCRSQTATGCDPDTGCIYPPLPAGAVCDETDKCNVATCTADGSCQKTTPVVCNGDCQTCLDGACIDINEFSHCGGVSTKICQSGVCESPCGAACEDFCVEVLDVGEDRSFDFRCCPDYARHSDGRCCWKGNTFGTVSADDVCTIPEMICSDGLACRSECCETSVENPKGVCPSATQFCVANVLVTAGGTCTLDAECVAVQGTGAVCAGLDYDIGEGGPVPVPNSGECCPSGYYFTVAVSDHPLGFATICCSPGSQPSHVEPGCCPFPDQNSQCVGCSCSLGTIRRCC
jgi:HYR domain